ncbi:MAG: RCC1 domain-containing protein [Sandaracinaceae bacterium]
MHVDATEAARESATRLRVSVVSLVSDSGEPAAVREVSVDALPTAVTATPRVRDGRRRFMVVAELLAGDAENVVARRRLVSGFVEGERRALYVWLDVGDASGLRCADRQTWDGETCAGACVREPEVPRDFEGRGTPSESCNFTCVDADSGTPCEESGREGRCWNGGCCLGCFDGVACRSGDAVEACGYGGESCTTCVTDPPCGDRCEPPIGTTRYACTPAVQVASLAAGERHTCVSSPAGVHCFGHNEAGQLGIGTTESTSTPMRVRDPLSSLTAGQEFTCGIDRDHKLVCWGSRAEAQLGDGAGPSPRTTPPSDVDLRRDPQRFSVVSAGRDHACALTLNGEAYCWGQNSAQQTGLLSTETPSTGQITHMRTQVMSDLLFTEIDAGTKHTCAIADEILYCWGGCCGTDVLLNPELATIIPSMRGTLPDGTQGDIAYLPRRAGEGFHGLSAGRFGTCVLDRDNAPWCSGGAKQSFPEYLSDNPLPLWQLPAERAPARLVEQGHWDRVCVIAEEDGRLACADERAWLDSADRGQTVLPLYSRWTAVSSGVNHICAIREGGALHCWGVDANLEHPFAAEHDSVQVGVSNAEKEVLYRVCVE